MKLEEDTAQDNDHGQTGLVFDVQRFSTEDGPGIRTTVFLKGCPMSCPWCHNPEGIAFKPQLAWNGSRCIGDGRCVAVCPSTALSLTAEGIRIDRSKCKGCGECERACPAATLEMIGMRRTVQDLTAKVLRDKAYYKQSGGGVTLSGGEPAFQAEFSQALMRSLRQAGVHLALDTCGGTVWSKLLPLVELSDLVLYDLKTMDRDSHRKYTGLPLELVLDNASRISQTRKPMWIRTPVIPGYTDDHDNIRNLARFIRRNLPSVKRFDLLCFNYLCRAKYDRLNYQFALAKQEPVAAEQMNKLAETAREEGLNDVFWSGLTGAFPA